MRAYGPVPSRRLGRSLGVNNIPAKRCTYSCIYCQLGRTVKTEVEREIFFDTVDLVGEVRKKVNQTESSNEKIDYLSFVPDGEPTLDKELGLKIDLLKPLRLDIAVISNGSLLGHKEVRSDLGKADWVSIKVDSVTENVRRHVNRPEPSLKLERILEGAREFSKSFDGTLATETMLIKDINDEEKEARKVASFIKELNPDVSYLAIPTRPPAEEWAQPTTEARLARNYEIFNKILDKVEYLIGYEGDEFASTGDVKDDLLSITSVHPMREEGVRELLKRRDSEWFLVQGLLDDEKLKEVDYDGNKFYIRKFSRE